MTARRTPAAATQRRPRAILADHRRTRTLDIGDRQGHGREDVGPSIDVAVAQSFGIEDVQQAGGVFAVLGGGHDRVVGV